MTEITDDLPVIVVGAGLAGLSLAVSLHRLRIPVLVFDKACYHPSLAPALVHTTSKPVSPLHFCSS